jgi:transcriptional regulator with XRE-family HTH domain
MYANIAYMSEKRTTLGSEIRRLRERSRTTLRGFAQRVGVSAPHLSDVERDRRRPSKELLKKIVGELRTVGATHAGLDRLDTRFESDLQEWAGATPEVRLLLRKVKESGLPISEVLKELERSLRKLGKSA